MSMTVEETRLLDKLASGALDGAVGDEREYRSYRSVLCGMRVSDGIPIAYRQWKPADSVYDQIQSDAHDYQEEKHYDTDERKLEFLQRFGWLMDDDDVRAYSAKYKPVRRGSAIVKGEDRIDGKILELELAEVNRRGKEAVLQERKVRANKAFIGYLAICALSMAAVLLLGIIPSPLSRESKMWGMLIVGVITPCFSPFRYAADCGPIKKMLLYLAQVFILVSSYVLFFLPLC